MDLREALKRKFAPPEWFSEFEATLDDRRADFVAANLWKSRGYLTVAVEIKTSRSDWLREIKTPEKQDTIGQYVDAIYLAVPDANIVEPGELPAGWGLLVPRGQRLMRKVAPAVRTSRNTRTLYNRLLLKALNELQKQDRTLMETSVKAELASQTAALERRYEDCVRREREANASRTEFERVTFEILGYRRRPEEWRAAMTFLDVLHRSPFKLSTLHSCVDRAMRETQVAAAHMTHLKEAVDAIQATMKGESPDDRQDDRQV